MKKIIDGLIGGGDVVLSFESQEDFTDFLQGLDEYGFEHYLFTEMWRRYQSKSCIRGTRHEDLCYVSKESCVLRGLKIVPYKNQGLLKFMQ